MPVPEQIDADRLADYLEIMTKAVFQAGVSWALIDKKWPSFRKAFADFEPTAVADFGEAEIERLCQDASILRSRNKIAGTIKNARTMLELEKEFGSFRDYLHTLPDYQAASKDLRKRFKYMGELNVYYFLFRVKEPVPPFEDWIKSIEGDHPRMREMVELSRQTITQS